jgi:enoyl-CoA hydratase/carnithine racemase
VPEVALEQDGPLAVLTFDSPPLNLWTAELGRQLREVLDGLAAQPPRGLLIRAEGRAFTGGVDVHEFDGLTAATGGALWEDLLGIVHAVEDLPCPTVFAAHALCLTWGLELALVCDVLLASDKARFGLVERVVGIVPSMGGVQRMALRAGPARAAEFVMTGDLYDAETLERWGVVNRVLPVEGFDAAARAFATGLAEGPTRAHAVTKRLIRAAGEGGARAADALVPEHAGALFDTEDARAAIASFLEHGPGKASYTGR